MKMFAVSAKYQGKVLEEVVYARSYRVAKEEFWDWCRRNLCNVPFRDIEITRL